MSKLLLDLLARQGNENLEIELGNGDTAVIVPESAEEIAEMAAENVVAETSEEPKEEVVLPASFVNNVTSEGDLGTVIDDTRTLSQTLDLLVRHLNDIDAYLK